MMAEVDVASELGKHAANPIRVGSPFAVSNAAPITLYRTAEEAVRRESAFGGVVGSAIALVFAVLCARWFPLGAFFIAPMGILTALYGFLSRKPRTAIGLAIAHFCILFLAIAFLM